MSRVLPFVAAFFYGCTFAPNTIREADATVVGIDIAVAQYGSLTVGYKSGRVVSVPTSVDGAGSPSVKSEKRVTSSLREGATITDSLNIGGLE